MKKIINGKQCTIIWYIYDLKISHVEPDVLFDIMKDINDQHGHIYPPTITRGKIHHYLGMMINFSSPGKVKFTIVYCLGIFLYALPEYMKGWLATPDAHHSFYIANEMTHLSKECAEIFHRFVTQLLYM